MTIDIYVREKSGNREIRFPLLPEEFEFSAGDTVFVTHDIIGRGEAAAPSGTELGIYSWMSEFPGAQRKTDAMLRGTWKEPSAYDSILRDWKAKGTKLTLLITGYPVNVDVYIREYKSRGSGAFGDIVYELTFVEARDLTITTTTVPVTRPATSSSTYVIKSGDTLWGISQKFYGTGTKWKSIYDANKEIIEQTAKKYGKSSSDNGHWIYPGVKLSIPGVGSTSSAPSTSTQTTTGTEATTSAETETETEKEKTESYLTDRNEGVKELVSRAKSVLDRKLTM